MKIIVCRLEFHRYGTSALDTFTNEVKDGVYSNPTVFDTPPLTEVAFTAIQDDFSHAAAQYAQYGLTKKVAFLGAKNILLLTLDTMAAYVDTKATGNVSTIALAGFIPTSRVSQPPSPLERIESFTVRLAGATGGIAVEIPAYANQYSVNYNCICVEGIPLVNPSLNNGQIVLLPNDPTVRQDFNRTRRKVFFNLTPGTKYYFYVFATNSVSVSPLSNPQSIWAS